MKKTEHSFAGPIEGYVMNDLKANYWKVARSMPREDVLQEAYVVFLRCRRKYPDVEAKHFMALFKQAWYHEFTDLANEDTALRQMVPMPSTRTEDGDELAYEPVGELDNEGLLAVKLAQAPKEVSAVLNLFLSAPQEILDLALSSWRGRDRRTKAGGSKPICRLLGLDPDLDVMQQTEDYLSS